MHKLDYASPIGVIEIVGTEQFISSVLFVEREIQFLQKIDTPALLLDCYKELDEYFSGQRLEFSVFYKLEGTAFQISVWEALKNIQYGQTASYKEIAQQIENVKAVRAVGMTNSRNRICIIVPCHRIIGANGKLTGYAGGLWRKEWLLNHELKHQYILS
ncbi:methylated-DNA--[protein]-cysteine S-methyltransferase [Solibacillus sp. A46]|uniref:Methylated-DNA--protein-cysteine methyltransferase n=1 Tax=Solibacillus faecavium TaxID=2762221 RepID=A0ABR8Y1F3_9BACL|nr:methylated-DNA--[protein]-cysteine S-methyltransferase [Solibacillus faecavium]MBD8038030.1 methylated-DNA--[protein]-cysteine S-methyltransferase [Solibacillus faecavium]